MSDFSLVYRAVLTVTEGDAGLVDAGGGLWYKEFTIPAVNPATTKINQAPAESRIPALPEPDLTLENRGAFVLLQSATKVRLYWRGELQEDPEAGKEAISVMIEVFDLDTALNKLLEIDFKALRLLGYSGENQVVDLVTREFGQQSTYRIRLFESKSDAEAATLDVADGSDFETGEIARVTRSIDIDVKNNDRDSMVRVLTKLADTPGIS